MDLKKPTLIIATGIPGTGKSTVLKEFCRRNPSTFYLEKDQLNQAFLVVRPTSQGQIPSIEQTLEEYEKSGKVKPYIFFNGEEMKEVSYLSEFYGRHVRDQTYIGFKKIAEQNLELGKSPVIDCFVSRQAKDHTLAGFMAQLNNHPIALAHFTVNENILRQRLEERASNDPYAAERDKGKLLNDESWNKFLDEQPVIWPEMRFYNHAVIDTSTSLEESLGNLEAFVEKRSSMRDELIYRVNEEGKILGPIHYSVAHPKDKTQQGERHRTATAFIFDNDDPSSQKLLIQKRAGVAKSGVWDSSIGGHNKYGQTTLETIKREASEELFNNQPLPEGFEFKEVAGFPKETRPNDREYVILYEGRYPGPFNPGPEVSEVKFVKLDELRRDMAANPDAYTNSIKFNIRKYEEANKI